jgi:hypothetical protein
MEILNSILIILGLMFVYVLFQSRGETLSLQLYFQRMVKLCVIFFNYIKDVGYDMATRFQETDWSLKDETK